MTKSVYVWWHPCLSCECNLPWLMKFQGGVQDKCISFGRLSTGQVRNYRYSPFLQVRDKEGKVREPWVLRLLLQLSTSQHHTLECGFPRLYRGERISDNLAVAIQVLLKCDRHLSKEWCGLNVGVSYPEPFISSPCSGWMNEKNWGNTTSPVLGKEVDYGPILLR